MTDSRIAEIVKVSPPGAAIEVHEIRLTEEGRKALMVLRPPARVSPLAWLPVILVAISFVAPWGLVCGGLLRHVGGAP